MKIMFVSMFCLADPASGAAISVRTILQYLAERGHDVSSFSGACFDKSQYDAVEDMLKWVGFSPDVVSGGWVLNDRGVRHVAFSAGSTRVAEVAGEPGRKLVPRLVEEIDRTKPDVIITFGHAALEQEMRVIAKKRGIPMVFYLAHPGYKLERAFADMSLVFTDSKATHDLYVERMKLASTVIGKFIIRPNAQRPRKENRHITFVNPSYEKGVTLFYRIAEMMASTQPSARFFVVESRNKLSNSESRSGLPFSKMRNIHAIGLQSDMAEVFSRTHVLLMPSLWHESGGRVAIEALSLGIPVVSTDHGGLPEHLGDGAIRIAAPAPLRENTRLIPPPSVAIPWVSQLAQLWTDDDYWQERSDAALEKWKDHDPTDRVSLIERKLAELLER